MQIYAGFLRDCDFVGKNESNAYFRRAALFLTSMHKHAFVQLHHEVKSVQSLNTIDRFVARRV